MAEAVLAQQCPTCGAGLVTCVGGTYDQFLTGVCSACGNKLSMPNVKVERDPVYGAQHVHMGVNDAKTLAANNGQPVAIEKPAAPAPAKVAQPEPAVSEEPSGGAKA